jgi:biopolymer transport protein ExbD
MYTPPSRKRIKKKVERPNLIPVLDAVFIFIFFLLMSYTSVKVYEIPSNVPIVSESEPKKPPFSLTLVIEEKNITLQQGVAGKVVGTFGKDRKGEYDIPSLRNKLIRIKKRHKKENTIIFEPRVNVEYEELVKIMDAVRTLRRTDETLFRTIKGVDTKIKNLFDNIIFGNIQS